MAIALRAGVPLQAIASLACRRVKLLTRYDVAQLEDGDAIEVTLQAGSVPKGGQRVIAPAGGPAVAT